jgi:hypothetical protein
MTAKEFWNSQVPTDANKCYVSDFWLRRFDHEDMFRFAEAYASHAIAERMPTKEEIKNGYIDFQWALAAEDDYMDGLEDGFKGGCKWFRNRIEDKR